MRASGVVGRFRARTRSAFGGLPRWAKPSTITAATGVASGVAQLVVTPLPNGDSWMRRVYVGYGTYQASGNPMDIMGWDTEGNNAVTIAVDQLKQNAAPAIGTVVGFGIGAAVLKWIGM